MQIKNVAGISFAPRWAFQDQRNLPIRDGMLREIVINNERVHPVIHEPLAHRGAGKRREILIGRAIRSGRGNNCRVGHRPGFFENTERTSDVRVFLSDRDVDAIERTIILRPAFLGGLVQTRLADDGIDRNRALAGRAITDDQLTLAAADRNHRIDRHDAGLHRLTDAASLDDAGRNLFQRIKRFGLDRAFAIDRLAERVDDATEKGLADRHLQKFSRRLYFVAFGNLCRIAEQNRADLRFLEVQGETEDAAWEIQSSH